MRYRDIFLTADQHYNHLVGKKSNLRDFDDIHEMNETLIQNHNNEIGRKKCIVIHAGDFAYKNHGIDPVQIMSRLKGEKHYLVPGNHDKDKNNKIHDHIASLNWTDIQERMVFRHNGHKIIISHYAQMSWQESHYGSLHAFGHSHGSLTGMPGSIDVGVDAQYMKPIHIDDFILQAQASLDNCMLIADKIKKELDQRCLFINERKL